MPVQQRKGNPEDHLDAIAQQYVPDTAQCLALECGGKQSQEPLTAQEEQLELLRPESALHPWQSLFENLLQHQSVSSELTHAVGVPTTRPELDKQLPHSQNCGSLVQQGHEDDSNQEVYRLAVAEVSIDNSKPSQHAPQAIQAARFLQLLRTGECPDEISLYKTLHLAGHLLCWRNWDLLAYFPGVDAQAVRPDFSTELIGYTTSYQSRQGPWVAKPRI
mmetsp:Transcript_57672/g.105988  ORF Transcript_57672/g.105988 Transcript_57672/m.105988 type:complete len:219 (+) Transcript_57672:314-970(+)